MSDPTRVSALEALLTPSADDILYIVDNPDITPLSKKITFANLLAAYATLTGIETLANKTLTTPTIASFLNATHDHEDAAGGGNIATTAVTGVFGVASGGTGQSIFTKGDVLAASDASTLSKLAIGTDGQVLSANSAEATGLKWISAGSGDVTAAVVLTDNAIVRGDGGAKGVQTSGITISDTDVVAGINNVTGLDVNLVTGTAGTSGDISVWNADGDLVDGPTPPTGNIVGTTDSQALTNKTIDADSNTISNLAIGAEVSGTLAGDMLFNNKTIDIGGEPGTNLIGVGMITSAFALGATVAIGELVYLGSLSKWLLADASAVGTAGTVLLGICLIAGNDTNPTEVLLQGTFRDDVYSWTAGSVLYASETAGDITATAPITTDAVVRVLGWAITADAVLFNPSPSHITHV